MVQKIENLMEMLLAGEATSMMCEAYNEQVKDSLVVTFGRKLAEGVAILLNNVDDKVRTTFIVKYLLSDQLAAQAQTMVMVRERPTTLKRTGNIGRFVIYLRRPGAEDQLVHFTNQVSTVFYLLFLIQRSQNEGYLPPLNLRRNAKAFQDVYLAVYNNIKAEAVASRYQALLYREYGDKVRAGRANEIVNDIRRHLKVLFAPYDESFFPYAMTAHEHLTLPPDKIIFEGEATQLLQHNVL